MDTWEEVVCQECHKVFHPAVSGQRFCIPCMLQLGRKSKERLVYPAKLTVCEGEVIQKIVRKRNAIMRKRRQEAQQYVDMVERPFEVYARVHDVLQKVQDLSSALPVSEAVEDLKKYALDADTALKKDMQNGLDLLLESDEPFKSSVEEYAEQLPVSLSGKDKEDIKNLLQDIFTE